MKNLPKLCPSHHPIFFGDPKPTLEDNYMFQAVFGGRFVELEDGLRTYCTSNTPNN